MTIGDLSSKIAAFINQGCDINAEIYVDTEAREYDTHLFPVKNVCLDNGLFDNEHIVITIN